MKKTIFIALALAFTLTGCKKQTFEDRVIADVEHFNTKEAPKHMDVYTTLDSMSYDKSTQTIGYYYTVNGIADDVPPAAAAERTQFTPAEAPQGARLQLPLLLPLPDHWSPPARRHLHARRLQVRLRQKRGNRTLVVVRVSYLPPSVENCKLYTLYTSCCLPPHVENCTLYTL